MIHQRRQGEITILELSHGKANALDLELSRDLTRSLGEVEASNCRGVVITARGSIFSAGVDLYRVLDEGEGYIREFLPALTEAMAKLFFFTKPVVGAANGHAIAGGSVVLCACDHRLMARGEAKTGVPEVHVGVPFPLLALEILRFAVAPQYLQEVIYGGGAYGTEAALSRGLVDEVVETAELTDRACETAERLGALPEETFRLTKEQMRGPVRERYERLGPSHDERVMSAWVSPEVRETLQRYVSNTLGDRKRSPGSSP